MGPTTIDTTVLQPPYHAYLAGLGHIPACLSGAGGLAGLGSTRRRARAPPRARSSPRRCVRVVPDARSCPFRYVRLSYSQPTAHNDQTIVLMSVSPVIPHTLRCQGARVSRTCYNIIIPCIIACICTVAGEQRGATPHRNGVRHPNSLGSCLCNKCSMSQCAAGKQVPL